jgi:hypothetical protein
MNTRRWRTLIGASVIAAAVATVAGTGVLGSGASAATGRHAGAETAAAAVAATAKSSPAAIPALTPKEVLEATYMETANPGSTLAANTDEPMDGLHTITCPAPTGKTCTIMDTVSIQEGYGGGAENNQIAAPWQLDGNLAGAQGALFSTLPADASNGNYAGGTWVDFQHGVTPGKHKIQTFAYSEGGAMLLRWAVTYTVYEP